ncbi:MAG: alanine racemase [candidate division WOR-3 bacterium]|nr:MAG: alanine racemase [candidate division WOR-3 bacterium]
MDFGRIWAEIDLSALNHNLGQVRSLVPDRKMMVAVKADAYGHGLSEIALELQGKVEAFGVAGVEEGAHLREAGVDRTDIIVLSPVPYSEIPLLFERSLVPSVTELEFARRLSAESRLRDAGIQVHIEVDTGMGRTGISVSETAEFIPAVAGLPGLEVQGVFTHFPAADNDVAFTESQVKEYEQLLDRLEAKGLGPFVRHAANSAGLMNVPVSRLDMARPGLVVYGILPDSYYKGERETGLDLKPVMSLRSRIVNLRDIPAGRSISYDRNFFTKHDSRIAVITAGYGDGYPWSLTNRGQAIVSGRRVPVVGNVCMDLTMLDVTGVQDVSIGQTVTLFGTADGVTIPVNEVAAAAGTIPYEIICRVSPRVPRVYLKNGKITEVRNLLSNPDRNRL